MTLEQAAGRVAFTAVLLIGAWLWHRYFLAGFDALIRATQRRAA